MIIIPIAPKPQSRPRFGRLKSGRTITYEEHDTKSYKENVAYTVKATKRSKIEAGPIAVVIHFYIYPPGYLLKAKRKAEDLRNERIYCDKKPDIDNYVKAILDASNGILYKDDGQIAVLVTQKIYSLNPRTELELIKL